MAEATSTPVKLRGEAAEVALGEAQAVLAMVQDPERRGRLADLIAAVGDGAVEGDDAQALDELLELGLQSGRIRAVYGPGGEQAALRLWRQLPSGQDVAASAKEVAGALSSLEGRPLEGVAVKAVGPGAYTVDIAVEGRELSIKLDRQGARLGTIAL